MAKKQTHALPRLSRIDFFRLRGAEVFELLFRLLERELGEGEHRARRWAKLNAYQQGLYAWWCFWTDVLNGGLAQYFYNHTDAQVPCLHLLLTESGNASMAALLNQATSLYRKYRPEFQVDNPFGTDGLFARMTELAKLDRSVGRQIGRTDKPIEKWLRSNISLIAVGDTGEPIDPKFTGEIETRHPNGKIFEQAIVRRGKLTGAFRRYLDDGTLEYTCFYEGGEVSSNYWPNGQCKQKPMKRGKLKVIEWYYPSGNLQKRYLTDKTGYALEPVRFWYENGQLAEEVYIKEGKKYGPWLRFFEDGSPRLQAEYREDETLVVMNAWDDQRRQVVQDGMGTFFDDGRAIHISYDLLFKSDWTSEKQLRNGIPHGLATTWHCGILWSRRHYESGKLHGLQTLYYDNGRERTRTHYRDGKETRSEAFPKFDEPRPAVLLSIEANARLYEAWGHPLLEDYPTARNLEQVQARLEVPPFLNEVFQRNLSGALKEDYENLNTFDDRVAYMVMVSEDGTVDSVDFSGASAYSGSTIDVYPPLIRELAFHPGRRLGRNVRCRVVAWVRHTFVEGRSFGKTRTTRRTK